MLQTTMKILVLEDDPRVSHFLEEALKAESHQVMTCATLSELSDFIHSANHDVDVAVFDRMIQHEDSLNSLRAFRTSCPQARILMLSAINTPQEKARALDMGADDYLGKPYSFQELSARIRALGRRVGEVSPQNTHLIQCGELLIDTLKQSVTVAGQKLELSAKEFRLLVCLCRRVGQVFNRFQLLDHVWDVQADIESNVVESTVRNLRRKLEEMNATVKILSKRNTGYWIEA
jgi:DNA-binding response OmpR family regulator